MRFFKTVLRQNVPRQVCSALPQATRRIRGIPDPHSRGVGLALFFFFVMSSQPTKNEYIVLISPKPVCDNKEECDGEYCPKFEPGLNRECPLWRSFLDSGFRVPRLEEKCYATHEGYQDDDWELRFTSDGDETSPKELKRMVESCLTNNADMKRGRKWTVRILEELFVDIY